MNGQQITDAGAVLVDLHMTYLCTELYKENEEGPFHRSLCSVSQRFTATTIFTIFFLRKSPPSWLFGD